jgi:hypothetical protein
MTPQEQQSLYELAGEAYALLSDLEQASNGILMKVSVPEKDLTIMQTFLPKIHAAQADMLNFRLFLKPA